MDKELIARKLRLAEEQKKQSTLMHEMINEKKSTSPKIKPSQTVPKNDLLNAPSHHIKN